MNHASGPSSNGLTRRRPLMRIDRSRFFILTTALAAASGCTVINEQNADGGNAADTGTAVDSGTGDATLDSGTGSDTAPSETSSETSSEVSSETSSDADAS